MNLRITTYLAYEGDGTEIKELVQKFNDAVKESGFSNNITDENKALKSLIVVKENKEIYDSGPNEFFSQELDDIFFSVIPGEVSDEFLEEEEEEVNA